MLIALVMLVNAWQTRDAPVGVAPDISGALLDGTLASLSDLRGQPVLLHFWATWCPICALEQGSIDAIARDHAVLTVAVDDASPGAIRRYLEEQGVDYPVLHDPDYRIAARYGIRGLPASFVLDTNGYIRFAETGYTSSYGLRARLWWAGL